MTEQDVNPGDMARKVERYTDTALEKFTIGLADNGEAFVYLTADANPAALPLRGRRVKRMIRKWAHEKNHLLRNDELNDIIENLYAHAAVNDDCLKVYLRVGMNESGFPELDLGTEDRRRILFKDGKASIVSRGSQTLFIRPETMLPMPIPAKKGAWKPLFKFLNVAENEKYLILAWITYVITHPRGEAPYPILVLRGAQGTGKSLLGRSILRPLVDNNVAGIQLFPRDVKDIAISSAHQYMLVYDNVRSLTKRQSDDLCVMATGGTMSSRRLYTDGEEFMLQVHGAIVLNGIHNFIQETDLASRVINATTQPLDYSTRRDEVVLSQSIQKKLPKIFRGVVDLAAKTLLAESTADVVNPERLMNFSRWLAAMEVVLKLPKGKLQTAYSDNLRQASLDTVQENVLAVTLLRFMEKRNKGHWQGTATELLTKLSKLAPANTVQRQSEWPQNAIALSKRLKPLEALVKPQGITIGFSHGTQRIIDIHYVPRNTAKPLDRFDGPDDEDGDIPQEAQDAASTSTEVEIAKKPVSEIPPVSQFEVVRVAETEARESQDEAPLVLPVLPVTPETPDQDASPPVELISGVESDATPSTDSYANPGPATGSGGEIGADYIRDLEDPDLEGTTNG